MKDGGRHFMWRHGSITGVSGRELTKAAITCCVNKSLTLTPCRAEQREVPVILYRYDSLKTNTICHTRAESFHSEHIHVE